MVSISTPWAQVAHDFEDFLVGLAEADHQAGLGRHPGTSPWKSFAKVSECW